jgi:hypothetical protein
MRRELRIIAVLVTAVWYALPSHADDSVPACKLMSDA